MPLTVDSVVHGPSAKLPARAMMLALSEELFNHLRDAVKTQRAHPTTNGNHPPPPVQLEFTRSQSATEKSPGSLYIGGQPLRLTGIPERIFDLYAQPHVPNDTPNTNPLRLHAIVSQSLKVPLSLTENLTERLNNRTASEQKERSKRGVVRIDSPVVQANPKKRKVSPSAQQTATAPAAVPKRAPPRPSQPSVQTLAGPPLSAETLARQVAARSNASASDSSSSSSQPLAQQAPPRPNSAHTTTQPPISSSASYSSDKVTPQVSSTTHLVHPAPPSSASVPPPISTPISARIASEGWKTSNFRGGVKTKDPPKSKSAGGASASGSTKARTVKSKPVITDDHDQPSPAPTASASSPRAAAVPDVSSAKSGSGRGVSSVLKAGTKRARERPTPATYDASAADSDLLAAVDVANSKRGTARGVEAELIAAAAATTNGKKAVSAKSTSATVAKKARAPNIDDELLDAAAAPSKLSGLGANTGKGKTRVAKVSYDDEDWDAREERKQLKKASGRASTASTPTSQHPITTTSVNGKAKKTAVIPETAVRASPPVRANGHPGATVGKKRPFAQSSAVTSTSNGNVNGSTTNRVSSTSHVQTNGSAKSVTTNGVSAAATKRSGHAKKRTSPIYTDSEEEIPSKPIPNVPKTKPLGHAKHAAAGSGAVPPSPVSMTTTSTSKPAHNNPSSSRASGGAPAVESTSTSTPVPIKKRPRLIAEAEDKKTDTLMARPLPRSRSALREHYDACYATYIELWARIIKERRRQQRLLQNANGNGTGGGSDNEEYSSSADSVGENVKALTDRYGKLHERLQTIRTTLGIHQQVV